MKLFCTLAALLITFSVFAQTKHDTAYGAPVVEDNFERVPEVFATYPGGQSALMKYISEKVTYKNFTDDEASRLRQVVAHFTISETGAISNVVIIKSSNIARVDSAFVWAIKAMPNWMPATTHGKAVKQQYALPLRMCLQ